jgi:hypothetical protein
MRIIGPVILVIALLALFADSALAAAPPDSPTKGRTAAVDTDTAQESSTTPDSQCLEDEPCWDWANMGNRKRGVVTLWGNFKVVGPCQFNRLWAQGKIRHTITVDGKELSMMDRLKGDRYARTLTDCPWRIWRTH